MRWSRRSLDVSTNNEADTLDWYFFSSLRHGCGVRERAGDGSEEACATSLHYDESHGAVRGRPAYSDEDVSVS